MALVHAFFRQAGLFPGSCPTSCLSREYFRYRREKHLTHISKALALSRPKCPWAMRTLPSSDSGVLTVVGVLQRAVKWTGDENSG